MAKISDFYKCGEITTSIQVGKKMFAFNCIFCTTIHLELKEFTSHIEENHYNELYEYADIIEENNLNYTDLCGDNNIKEVCVEKSNHGPLGASNSKFPGHQLDTQNPETTIPFDDPLEEAPISMDSEVLPLCTINDIVTAKNVNDANSDGSGQESYFELKSKFDKGYDMTQNNSTNMDLLIALIDEYKKNRILWDPIPWDANAKNRRKREEAIKAIAQTIKEKLNISLRNQEVGKKIKEIREKLRNEMQNKKFVEAQGGIYNNPSIYFEQLEFLKNVTAYKPFIKNKITCKTFLKNSTQKPRNNIATTSWTIEKPALPLPNLTDAQNVKIIQIYKSFPCLWDTQHIGFRSKEQKTEAIEEMMKSIRNQMHLDLTEDELLNKLDRIRYACTQDKHRKLECARTQTEFSPSNKYFEQISFLVDHVGPFKCDFCEKTFNSPDQYRTHKANHDGSMPFRCPICNRGFMQAGNCTVHVRRHTRDYPFDCKVCGKRFATTTDVNVHMRYHTGEKPYFCEVCGQSFRTYSLFNTHRRRHQKRPSHFCTICDKAFYENNKLTDHMKAHLNIRDKVCNVCGKAFTCSKYLRQHKQIHAEKKKYVCKICKKDFAQSAGLSGHMRSHGTIISGGLKVDDQH